MSNEEVTRPSGGRGEIVIYQPQVGEPVLEVRLDRDTVWLDAHQMAALFGRDRTVILRHVRNIYTTQELLPEATCAKNAQVAADGRVRQMDLYNLDMILSVGYRVNSKRGTQFRIWAALFLWFTEKNGILYRQDGAKRIADNALVAITLMIAESAPEQRKILTHIIVELINDRN